MTMCSHNRVQLHIKKEMPLINTSVQMSVKDTWSITVEAMVDDIL